MHVFLLMKAGEDERAVERVTVERESEAAHQEGDVVASTSQNETGSSVHIQEQNDSTQRHEGILFFRFRIYNIETVHLMSNLRCLSFDIY